MYKTNNAKEPSMKNHVKFKQASFCAAFSWYNPFNHASIRGTSYCKNNLIKLVKAHKV